MEDVPPTVELQPTEQQVFELFLASLARGGAGAGVTLRVRW
jgi:hypothetical protein